MKRTLFLWLFGLILTAQVYAQNRSLSGTVKDAKGEALIGVNVTGKGTTIGTVTDIDGKYALELPKDVTTIVFSYVGYDNIEKTITALKADVVMAAEGQKLEEVVVTAQNVTRNKSSIIYAQSTVKSDELNKVSNKSALSALQGKVAGVNITSASGAVGASTRVVLRGETSLIGNNNALIIVDGVPVNNSSTSGGAGTDRRGNADRDNYVDFGNRGNDINPDDIETINVLKGPAATSLYGSKGSAGVILITTKKGRPKKADERAFKVSIGSSMSFDRAYILLKRQDKFGSGYASSGFTAGPVAINMGENYSWGPKFDGVLRPWTALPTDENGNIIPLSNGKIEQLVRPYSAVKDQLQSFFDIGITNKNSVSFEGGSDKYQFYASYINTNQKGTVPYTYFKKNSILLNANADFSDKVNVNFSANYSNIKQRGATEGSYPYDQAGGAPAYAMALQTSVGIPFSELRDYNSPYADFKGYYGQYTANPYFLLGEFENTNSVDNFIGKLEVNYKPFKSLTLTARAGTNFLTSLIESKRPVYSYNNAVSWIDGNLNTYNIDGDFTQGRSDGNYSLGGYKTQLLKRNILNIDLIANYSKVLGKRKLFNINILGGLNSNDERSSSISGTTVGGLVVPNFYNLSNSSNTPLAENSVRTPYRLLGLYTSLSLGYKNVLTVEYSARNDWSSKLTPGKNSYFYQSGGVSFRPTELFKSPNKWLTYLKLRGDIGTTGNDPYDQYLTQSTFVTNGALVDNGGTYDIRFPFNSQSGSSLSTLVGNPEIKPELTVTYEGGIDLGLFKDRLSIEYTYYSQNAKNQIVEVDLPPSSGFRRTVINVGRMTNKGHELTVKATPVKNKWIDWSLFFTFSKNKSNVVKVSESTDEITLTGSILPYASTGTSAIVAKEGMPYGTFKVLDYLRDPNGNIVVNSAGIPLKDSKNFSFVSSQAKFRYSFGTDINIKGLNIHCLFDGKVGGKFMSMSRISTDGNGSSLESAANDRHSFVVPGSVIMNADSTYSPNFTQINPYQYYDAQPAANALVDATYLKLREISVNYTVPFKAFGKSPISSITIGLFGKNLKYWVAKSNQFADPETSGFGLNGNGQNIESQNTPSSRSYGFDFKINF